MDNALLLERARALDEEALAAVHDLYYPQIYRYVRYRLGDEDLVEDISAEVFLRLLDALSRRGGDIRDLRAWLLGTASNLIHDHLRHKYRHPVEKLADLEHLSGAENPAGIAEETERQKAVFAGLKHLTADQRQVLALRFLLECSIEDTARLMHKSTGAIKVLQFRALAALRNHVTGKKKA
jgi:RNA polymerase sigma-70 factor (ECF subfamily)